MWRRIVRFKYTGPPSTWRAAAVTSWSPMQPEALHSRRQLRCEWLHGLAFVLTAPRTRHDSHATALKPRRGRRLEAVGEQKIRLDQHRADEEILGIASGLQAVDYNAADCGCAGRNAGEHLLVRRRVGH